MSIEEIYNQLEEDEKFTKEDMYTLQALLDPVIWSEKTLKSPIDPTKPLQLRYYQKETLRFQSKLKTNEKGEQVWTDRIKVYRFGRRTGKTVELAVEALHKACTNHNFKVLYIAPFESQCNLFFNMIEALIVDSIIQPKRFVRKPFMCQLKNGSTITAHTANVRSTRKGSTIRGAEGDLIILDEMDHGVDDVINEVVMPIFMGNDRATIVGASTPTGRRGLFYLWCTEGLKMGIKPYHFPSMVSPRWNSESDKIAKKTMTRDQYIHEILAEFGEALEGVFKHKDLDIIMSNYKYENLKFDRKKNYYIMGIDWNESFGTCIIIVEKSKSTGKNRIFRHVVVPKQEFTQLEGVEKIKQIHKEFPCDFIYADHGYGSTQIELLKKEGLKNPMSRLDRIVYDIDYGGNIEIRDPLTGKKEKKPAKAFLVDNTVLAIEARNMNIPEDEDTEYGLIGQMRNFRVSKFSKSGHPIYDGKVHGRDNDHSLNALMLAILGYTLQFGDLTQYETSNQIVMVPNAGRIPGYCRESVDTNNDKFLDLIAKVCPNFDPNAMKQKIIFISAREQAEREQNISKIRKRRFGISRETF